MLLRIGTCRIDTDRRQIVRDGGERHLPRKPFELLLALLDARPNVVTKDTLIARVWPDAFVSDSNLAVLIGDIRAAIGDSARRPRLIKTHHAVGYSFIGEVLEVAGSPSPAPGSPIVVLSMGTRHVELAGGRFTVGRDAVCDVVLPHRSVSRIHARLNIGADGVIVEDGDSKNGTRINGTRIAGRAPVHDGDQLRFGSLTISVAIGRAFSGSTETVADAD